MKRIIFPFAFAAMLVLSMHLASAAVNPEFRSLSISTDVDTANVYWYIDHLGANTVKVDCELNEYSCTYTGEKGYGGCSMQAADLYDLTKDGDAPEDTARTVVNELQCETYNSSLPAPQPDEIDTKSLGFYPLAFKVTSPLQMAMTVGVTQQYAFVIKNNGTIDDLYQVEITTDFPNFIRIGNGEQTTEVLSTKHSQQISSDVILLTSEVAPKLKLEIRSSIDSSIKVDDLEVDIRGDYMSLPDIRNVDIFQILAMAVILVTFLF